MNNLTSYIHNDISNLDCYQSCYIVNSKNVDFFIIALE